MKVMTTREDTLIHSVKISRPEYHQTHSYRSSSASHENTSDYASEASSTARKGYETPPSRISTPSAAQDNGNEMVLPIRPEAAMHSPLTIRHVGPENTANFRASSQIPETLDEMSPPTPGIDDTPYIRFAIEQLSFDEELAGRGRHSSFAGFGIPRVASVAEVSTQNPASLPVPSSSAPGQRPNYFRFPSTSSKPQTRVQEILLPVDSPDGTGPHRLGYVPMPLRLPMLILLVFVCSLMIAGIIFSNVYALRNNGLYDYDGYTTSRYFVFQYLPQLLGIIILLWISFLQAAVYRILPYFSMSAELPHDRLLQDMPTMPANFVLPDLRFFRLGEPLIGVSLLIFWTMNLTIPLLSSLYQTQYYFENEPLRWRWTSVQGIGWCLVVLYLILLVPIFYCMVRFRERRSALKSDPASIADLIILFQRSNILHDFDQSEVVDDLRAKIPSRFLRLGYWTPSQTPETYYTVGQANGPLNRMSLQLQPKGMAARPQVQSTDSFDIERHRYSHDSSFTRNIHSPFLRYRWCPWFLRDSAVLAWIIAALLLLIAFLVVSFVNRAVQRGFFPLLNSITRSNGFSPSDFLYSFMPALLGQFLFLCWQPIDTFYRGIQPYANLSNPNGTTAQKSLLQSYSAQPVGIVTVTALANGDFKLAYVTFISLFATVIPVLAGGVFAAFQYENGEVRMRASMPGYIALCVFLSIYVLSYLVIWPSRTRYLPHPIDTIAGHLSFLYASPLLNDPSIRAAQTRSDLAARLCGYVSPISPQNTTLDEKGANLTGNGRQRPRVRQRSGARGIKGVDRQLKYAYGIYIGRDGKEHLGIDRLQRPGSGEMLVVTGIRRSLGSRSR